jgi:hypothetical protein
MDKAFVTYVGIGLTVAGCAAPQPMRPLPPTPYANMILTDCRAYSGFTDCKLKANIKGFEIVLGGVQSSRIAPGRYQVMGCWPIGRVVRPLPTLGCELATMPSHSHAGDVVVKGGTAVRLAKYLGDREQLHYRWKRDPWSRIPE